MTTLTTPATRTVKAAEPPMQLTDMCDSCGYSDDRGYTGQLRQSAISQAYVRATLPSGKELLFCGHHAASHEVMLLAIGAVFYDERERLGGYYTKPAATS